MLDVSLLSIITVVFSFFPIEIARCRVRLQRVVRLQRCGVDPTDGASPLQVRFLFYAVVIVVFVFFVVFVLDL